MSSGSGGPRRRRGRETAALLTARAGYAAALADHTTAASAYREADAHWATPPPDTDATQARVAGLIRWSNTERLRGHHRDALKLLTTARDLADQTQLGPAVQAAVANALGVLAKDTGHYAEALVRYREPLAALTEHDRSNDALRATVQHNLAGLAHIQGDFAAAEAPARRAVTLRRALPDADRCVVAADETVLGAVLSGLGQLDEAEQLFRESLEVWSARYGPGHYEVAVNLHNVAAIAQARKQLDEADGCSATSSASSAPPSGTIT